MIAEQINLVKRIAIGHRYDLAINSDSSIETQHKEKLASTVITVKPVDQNYMYEHQYYDWLMHQVRLLNSGRTSDADLKHIAEELEDMGNEAEAALTSFIRQTMVHLCKLEFSRDQNPANHWRVEIANFRAEVDDRIVNRFTNEAKLSAIYAKAWKKVPSILAQSLSQDEFAKIPTQCPYSIDQVRNEEFFPLPVWETQTAQENISVYRPK
jgi:hypothetical protein